MLDHESEPELTVLITASDTAVPSLSTTVEYIVKVDDEDEAPTFVSELTPPQGVSGSAFDWTIPSDSANDPEGDGFEFDIAATDGAIPDWLAFHQASGELSGLPSSKDVGQFELVVSVIQQDSSNLKSSVTVSIVIGISATPLHNTVTPQDVNGDSEVTANDALRFSSTTSSAPRSTNTSGRPSTSGHSPSTR